MVNRHSKFAGPQLIHTRKFDKKAGGWNLRTVGLNTKHKSKVSHKPNKYILVKTIIKTVLKKVPVNKATPAFIHTFSSTVVGT